MNPPLSPLDIFGKYMVRRGYDGVLEQLDMMLQGRLKTPDVSSLQELVVKADIQCKSLIRRSVADALQVALHDLLAGLQEHHDHGSGIEVLIGGVNIAQQSGLLNGELLGTDGWFQRFSQEFSADRDDASL